MIYNESTFLRAVKEEFEDRLDNIKIPDTCYDIEEGCWDEEKVREVLLSN